jgi:DNA polymerase-3 subunit delta'
MSNPAAVQAPCPWHRDELKDWICRCEQQRLPHALLLGGAAGIGKQRLARALLEWLLCERPAGGLACGQCRSCHVSASGAHPDYFRLAPEEAGQAIKVDQVRALAEFGERTAQYGGARVALVVPAEAMNRNAQNALLKTLEEPGEHTHLLLVSHQPGLLLPTIRSRCQHRRLPLPGADMAVPWLREQLGDSERAQALLSAAGGAPLKAVELEQADWFVGRKALLEGLVGVVEGRVNIHEAVQPLLKGDAVALLDALYGWTVQALKSEWAGRGSTDAELAPVLDQLARRAGRARLLGFADRLVRARAALRGGANPNHQLLFEALVLYLAGVDPAADPLNSAGIATTGS